MNLAIRRNSVNLCRMLENPAQMVNYIPKCSLCDTRTRTEILSSLLGVSYSEARQIIGLNRVLLRVDRTRIEKTVGVLSNIKIDKKDILHHPEVLTYTSGMIEQRYFCLKELGISPLGLPEILRCPVLLKMNGEELKKLQLLQADADPLVNILQSLQAKIDNAKLVSKHPKITQIGMMYIRRVVLLEILSEKLECPTVDIMKILKKYPSICNRSMVFIEKTIDALKNYMDITLEKIRTNGFLLMVHPDNIVKLRERLPIIGGVDVCHFVNKFPRVLSISVDHLEQTDNHLKAHGITAEQVVKCGNIYTLNPCTVKERLEELHSTAEFEVMKTYSRILFLVYYMRKAKRRLAHLKSIGYPYISLDMLSTSDHHYQRVLNFGDDRPIRKELVSFVAKKLKKPEAEVNDRLKHPFTCNYQKISVLNLKKLWDMFQKRNFTSEQIFNALHLFFYEVAVVEAYLDKLPVLEEAQPFSEWHNNPYLLHLVLYILQKHQIQLEPINFDGRIDIRMSKINAKSSHTSELKYGRYLAESTITEEHFLNDKE